MACSSSESDDGPVRGGSYTQRDHYKIRSDVDQRSASEATDGDGTRLTPDQGIKSDTEAEMALRRKIDLRLCPIAGILVSLDLLDSNIISSASVTGMFDDLQLYGNRYSISIFIFTVASIAFQLPATLAVRYFGVRIWFACITFAFGLITLCTAFIHTWKEMIALRVLLGIAMSGVFPGLSYLISTWYVRKEQGLRYAYLQVGGSFVLATGGIVNFGLRHLSGRGGLAGWRWMFLIQGLVACVIGIATYWWIPSLPDQPHTKSFRFLTADEQAMAAAHIQADRADVEPTPFSWKTFFQSALDVKVYGFAAMFFLLNLVSTGLSYFLPIVLVGGLGFSSDTAIILNAPPYYWGIIPAIVSSYISDKFKLRGPVIVFNSMCLIAGFSMLGFVTNDEDGNGAVARYIGTCLATGAYVSNWAALNAYYANNVTGQWKRVFTAAVVTSFNGAGGIAGSFIFIQKEAPRYMTAVWTCIGSHIGMILLVGLFSIAFYIANGQQRLGKRVIEGTPGFRHTY